jgi:hypothetical protein
MHLYSVFLYLILKNFRCVDPEGFPKAAWSSPPIFKHSSITQFVLRMYEARNLRNESRCWWLLNYSGRSLPFLAVDVVPFLR